MTHTKKGLISIISMLIESIRRDLYTLFQKTRGTGDVFWKPSVDLTKRETKIELCGITQEKDDAMTSTGKGELKEGL